MVSTEQNVHQGGKENYGQSDTMFGCLRPSFASCPSFHSWQHRSSISPLATQFFYLLVVALFLVTYYFKTILCKRSFPKILLFPRNLSCFCLSNSFSHNHTFSSLPLFSSSHGLEFLRKVGQELST